MYLCIYKNSHLSSFLSFATEMHIARDVLPDAIKEVVKGKIDDGAWMAHSEILLLHLLASEDEEQRRFAINKILALRAGSEFGETKNRPHKVPKLNWSAMKIEDMIVWESATEPLHTAKLNTDDLRSFLDKPFTMPPFPGHTQSVERLVKEVSAASLKVFGTKEVDGYVKARCEARQLVPKADRKADFAAILK